MRLIFAASLAAVVNAHFHLQYPLPRGPFVARSEPTFCDGYANAVLNRAVFPISNGVIRLRAGHPTWTAGVIVSTAQNPSSFADFNTSSGYQTAVPYFQKSGEGSFCFPINIANSGVSGIHDGANVTIQVVFDGGDGRLYQCADLTLSSSATLPSDASSGCTNIVVSTSAAASPPSATQHGVGTKNVATVSGVLAGTLAGLVGLL